MFDTHYDLLTYILMKKDDDDFLVKLCKNLFTNNIQGGIMNTYYMIPKEMDEKLSITDLDPIKHLEITNERIERLDLLPNRENFVLAVEGASYLNLDKMKEVDKIYDLGVRSVILIYNTDNQYGGGCLGNKEQGLTMKGYEAVTNLVSKGMIIDISHFNEKTANDVLDFAITLKNEGINPIVIASHSNAKALRQRARNILDEIILKIGELDGIVGIVARKGFCYEPKANNEDVDYEEKFAEHIHYVGNLIGMDKVCISTDDMSYHPDKEYHTPAIYPIEEAATRIKETLLKNGFNEEETTTVMINNFKEKVLNKLSKTKNKAF